MTTALCWLDHLVIAPVLLPFSAGVLLLLLRDQSMVMQRSLALLAGLLQLGLTIALLLQVADGQMLVYRLGDWPAPWGIVLVADRLAAWMLLLTGLLALCALVYALGGTDTQGRHFHVLFQMQLFGLTGAFLTGDLFNLFVFFEILLIASYGLALHGGGPLRTRAGLHYVVMNLLGSSVFLFAAGLIYSALGSLNLADLAVKAARVPADNLVLARAGGLLLLAVFGLKAALVPLHLWLPAAYANTSAAVAALFAIMTKVGIYAILRTHTLLFGSGGGELAGLFDPWLLPLALVTLALATLGVLAAQNLSQMAAYLVVASVGTLLAALALGLPGIAAGLYYLVHSSFSAALLFLLADAIRRRRPLAGDRFTSDADMAQHALWGSLFFIAAIAAAGLPPLSGFVGKFLSLRATPHHPWVWAIILRAALASVMARARAGSALFFNTTAAPARTGNLAGTPVVPLVPLAAHELLAIGGLIGLILALTAGAGPGFDFAQAMAAQLADPALYIQAVLGAGR
jgi:multicomponent K+:H+ antiporter subunit D